MAIQHSTGQILARLGAGESIEAICQSAGISVEDFHAWWKTETQARIPDLTGSRAAQVAQPVRIERDGRGIPHVYAENDDDLFFGFGYAVAQDRLFQLDYLRRKALGTWAEVWGAEAVESDLVSRTVGLPQIAEREWKLLPEETQRLVAAYTAGVNALQLECAERLPIEFDLLGYRPRPWQPPELLAIAGEFRWYLTGRFPVIAIPELAQRKLGRGPLFDAFLLAEADNEAILPPDSYIPRQGNSFRAGTTISDPSEGRGSNNWVVSSAKSESGAPLVASDPHIAFGAVSCWHEIHLHGGSFNVAGTAYVGMPGILIGRNCDVAWGITNNICSVRDLYQERTSPEYPGCFQYDGGWEPAVERVEVIEVKGASSLRKTIRSSRNGPIVDEILPLPVRQTGPVSLRWQGAEYCGWLPALIGMNRANSADELRRATEPWSVPTFCLVYGDRQGNIGYQCTGKIPVRKISERAYRPGWDPAHQWQGTIPFAEMPHAKNPKRGWIATANNRVAADDFPWPLSGTWNNGFRAVRLRDMLESPMPFNRNEFGKMHQDCISLRAVQCVPKLAAILERAGRQNSAATPLGENFSPAISMLKNWNGEMLPESAAASIFNVFFDRWSQRVARERFERDEVAFVAGAIGGLASRLLDENIADWFASRDATATGDARRLNAVVESFASALQYLAERLGKNIGDWTWGRLHQLEQVHFLSPRGDLARLFDRGGIAVRGDFVTVCNTGSGPHFSAPTGAGYRMIADLADPHCGLWAVDAGSESGHVGSPHYDDQLTTWIDGKYDYLPLTGERPTHETVRVLNPAGA